MTEKELQRLRRVELLEILLAQSKEIDSLRDRLQQAEEKLRSRELMLSEAGSIAEASLRINQVFEAAQRAADQYIENIMRLNTVSEEKSHGKREP